MNIIWIFNGLGNQMSQYAFYLAKRKKCRNVMPCYFVSKGFSHNGQELTMLFGIKVKEGKFVDALYRFFYKFRGYSRVYNLTRWCVSVRFENRCYDYDPEQLIYNRLGINFFCGGWHCEKYFKDIEDEIRKIFTFNTKKISKESRRWQSEINNGKNSCSIHIRRGDFLLDKMWQGICTDEYYDKAIGIMRDRFPDIDFYVFSNDIPWCRENYGENGFHYIDCNSGKDSWQDMYLMTQCQHHINANSSFSWWGAWLCDYKDSLTIVPKQFLSDRIVKDIYPESWMKI